MKPPICSAPTRVIKRRPESEPRRADGDVGGTTAHGLREACDILEPAADLLAVKINGRAADGDQIERLVSDGVAGHVPFANSSSPVADRRRSNAVSNGSTLAAPRALDEVDERAPDRLRRLCAQKAAADRRHHDRAAFPADPYSLFPPAGALATLHIHSKSDGINIPFLSTVN